MKGTRYTNARRTQQRDAREQRVHAGVPSVRLDWRCPVCDGWYSHYRGRNIIHLQHCKEKRAKRIAREEGRRAQTPLPSPDRFTLHSTPDSTPIPRSPTREPSLTEDAQADPEDIFREPSLLDEAPEGDENPGKSGAVLPPC